MAFSLKRRASSESMNLLEGVIWKQILSFFFPILIGSFFQQLYNMVDTIVIGHAVGTNALAAVGATGSIISLLVGLFVGIAGGATVVIAQYYGARDAERMEQAVHTAIALSLSGAILLMMIGIPTAKPLLRMMNVPEEILGDASMYMQVYYAGIIGNLLYNIGTGILRSVGDSRTPLYILIVCCIVNIVLDLTFVLAFQWGVFGVAFATILSQAISAILVLIILMRTNDMYKVSLKKIRFHGMLLKQIIRIGLPNGMESVFYSISNVMIQTAINGFGTVAIASWSAIGRIDSVMWMVMQAFSISVSTMVGQNFGAKQYERVKKVANTGLWMNMASIFVVSVIIYAFCPIFLSIFTEDTAVIETGSMFLRVLAPSYMAYVIINVFACVIRGCGESFQPMLITVVFICGLRMIWLLVFLPMFHTMANVAMSYPISWVVTSVIFVVYYLRGRWMKRCIRRVEISEL